MMNKNTFIKRIHNQIKDKGQIIGIKTFSKDDYQADDIFDNEKGGSKASSIYMKGLVKLYPDDETLTEMGVSREQADIYARVTELELRLKGFINADGLKITQKDYIEYNGENYKISKIRPRGQYEQFLTYAITGFKE